MNSASHKCKDHRHRHVSKHLKGHDSPELSPDVQATIKRNIRKAIQMKIRYHAYLLLQLASSLSDDIFESALESVKSRENVEGLHEKYPYLERLRTESLINKRYRKLLLFCDSSSEDGKTDAETQTKEIQQDLVKHLKNEYDDLSSLMTRIKTATKGIVGSLSQIIGPDFNKVLGEQNEVDKNSQDYRKPLVSGPEDLECEEDIQIKKLMNEINGNYVDYAEQIPEVNNKTDKYLDTTKETVEEIPRSVASNSLDNVSEISLQTIALNTAASSIKESSTTEIVQLATTHYQGEGEVCTTDAETKYLSTRDAVKKDDSYSSLQERSNPDSYIPVSHNGRNCCGLPPVIKNHSQQMLSNKDHGDPFDHFGSCSDISTVSEIKICDMYSVDGTQVSAITSRIDLKQNNCIFENSYREHYFDQFTEHLLSKFVLRNLEDSKPQNLTLDQIPNLKINSANQIPNLKINTSSNQIPNLKINTSAFCFLYDKFDNVVSLSEPSIYYSNSEITHSDSQDISSSLVSNIRKKSIISVIDDSLSDPRDTLSYAPSHSDKEGDIIEKLTTLSKRNYVNENSLEVTKLFEHSDFTSHSTIEPELFNTQKKGDNVLGENKVMNGLRLPPSGRTHLPTFKGSASVKDRHKNLLNNYMYENVRSGCSPSRTEIKARKILIQQLPTIQEVRRKQQVISRYADLSQSVHTKHDCFKSEVKKINIIPKNPKKRTINERHKIKDQSTEYSKQPGQYDPRHKGSQTRVELSSTLIGLGKKLRNEHPASKIPSIIRRRLPPLRLNESLSQSETHKSCTSTTLKDNTKSVVNLTIEVEKKGKRLSKLCSNGHDERIAGFKRLDVKSSKSGLLVNRQSRHHLPECTFGPRPASQGNPGSKSKTSVRSRHYSPHHMPSVRNQEIHQEIPFPENTSSPTKTYWGLTQIEEFDDGSLRYNVTPNKKTCYDGEGSNSSRSRVQVMVTVSGSDSDIRKDYDLDD